MKWIRPSGSEIETNDLVKTIEACEAKGWKRADNVVKIEAETPQPKPATKKRGRPKKAD